MRGDVGPVVDTGPLGDAVLAAITAENPGARIIDRGAYRRVQVSGRCILSRAGIEAALGRTVDFPADLEAVMPSFAGALAMSEQQAVWT